MPYSLRKAPKRDLYWVVGLDGTKHSKEPLPKARAVAQMKALYVAMRKEKKGGIVWGKTDIPKEDLKAIHRLWVKGRKDLGESKHLAGTFDEFVETVLRKSNEGETDESKVAHQTLKDKEPEEEEYEEFEYEDEPEEPKLTIKQRMEAERAERARSVASSTNSSSSAVAETPQQRARRLEREENERKAKEARKAVGKYKAKGRHGGSWFGDLFKGTKKAISKIVSPVSTVVQRGLDLTQGIRRNFSPPIRKFLHKYGNLPIQAMTIRRDPIGSLINGAINAITLGKFDPAKKANNFDKLFHLSMECYLNPKELDRSMRVIVEKNEVINITPTDRQKSKDSEQMRVNMNMAKTNTLNSILDQAKTAMGDNFFLYDGFKNNCQDFIWNIVQANGQMTPELDKFIKQDVVGVAEQLPSYTAPVMNAITDLGGLVNTAIHGQGGRLPHARFASQLKKAGISPAEYLKKAQAKAKQFGLAYKHLGFSSDDKHKLQVPNASGTLVRFGSVGLGDHILYTLSGDPSADDHRKRYLARATKIKGDWKSERYSPNNLAIHILW